ncbi:TnpV protein [Agathobaculum sp.]
MWGQRHLRYIREHKKVFYTNLLTSGKLMAQGRYTDAANEVMIKFAK